MDESKLTRKIKKAVEAAGAYARKIHGSMYVEGIPDIVLCYRGCFIGLEVKMPGKARKLTQLQKHNLDQIEKAGGYGRVVTSVEEALQVLKEVDSDVEHT